MLETEEKENLQPYVAEASTICEGLQPYVRGCNHMHMHMHMLCMCMYRRRAHSYSRHRSLTRTANLASSRVQLRTAHLYWYSYVLLTCTGTATYCSLVQRRAVVSRARPELPPAHQHARVPGKQ